MIEIQLIVLGIVQGITEFLPISSSAHLIFVSELFNWKDQGINHDIAVHAGTLLAVIIYFRREINLLIKDIFYTISSKKSKQNFLYIKIIISTLPAIIVGFFIYNYFIGIIRNLHLIGFSCIFFGILLFICDNYFSTKKNYKEITLIDSLIIGIFQCFAFIPGASRAGTVITISRFLKLDRESSAIYSMLLSIPIIFGSFVLSLPELFQSKLNLFSLKEILLSSTIAFVAALISIKFMMNFIKKTSYNLFVIYRVILGLIILVWIYT